MEERRAPSTEIHYAPCRHDEPVNAVACRTCLCVRLGVCVRACVPRYTNTINLADGGVAMRPTVINCYSGDLGSMDRWWAAWRAFMFDSSVTVKGRGGVGIETKTVKSMLSTIKKAK